MSYIQPLYKVIKFQQYKQYKMPNILLYLDFVFNYSCLMFEESLNVPWQTFVVNLTAAPAMPRLLTQSSASELQPHRALLPCSPRLAAAGITKHLVELGHANYNAP